MNYCFTGLQIGIIAYLGLAAGAAIGFVATGLFAASGRDR
jgi:hypothetical protein